MVIPVVGVCAQAGAERVRAGPLSGPRPWTLRCAGPERAGPLTLARCVRASKARLVQ